MDLTVYTMFFYVPDFSVPAHFKKLITYLSLSFPLGSYSLEVRRFRIVYCSENASRPPSSYNITSSLGACLQSIENSRASSRDEDGKEVV